MITTLSNYSVNIISIISLIGIVVGWLLQFKKMEIILKNHSDELLEFKDERKIMLKSMLGIARRMKETGANGEITEVIKNLEDYLIYK